MSFTPEEMAKSVQEKLPTFKMSYEPDFRQAIADSWPSSIDDTNAREDWNWKTEFDLKRTTNEMIRNLK